MVAVVANVTVLAFIFSSEDCDVGHCWRVGLEKHMELVPFEEAMVTSGYREEEMQMLLLSLSLLLLISSSKGCDTELCWNVGLKEGPKV